MKKGVWKSDWFAGLVIAIVFAFIPGSAFIQSLERDAYDLGVRSSARDPGTQVAVIAIDDQSIDNIGRWPWSRSVLAAMVERLAAAQAKVVAPIIFLSEPQTDPGLARIRELGAFYAGAGLTGPAAEEMGRRLNAAETELDTDQSLAQALATAGNVVLAMQFVEGEPLGNPDRPLPESVLRNGLENIDDRVGAAETGAIPIATRAAVPPIPPFAEAAAGIGHLLFRVEVDGGIRTEPLAVRYYDSYFPSQSLLAAARSLNLGVKDIRVNLGEGIQLGNLTIGTDPFLRMQTFFYADQDGKAAFTVDSFYDIYTGKIPVEKYRDKIVLIGPTAFGVGAPQKTPISTAMEPVLIMAHQVASILNEDFFVTPSWAQLVEWVTFLLVAIYLIALLPRLKAGPAFLVTLALIIALLVTHLTLMTTQGIWLQFMWSATLLFFGYLLLTVKRFLVTERGKLKSDTESAESNRMLGLAFQQQGQLDMALEKFRKAPLDDSMMDPLYNLALDFERKRAFAKANAVYSYMTQHDPNFRDLKERMTRAKAMEETVLLGGAGARSPTASMLLEGGGVSKPMLGRYEVEKELGKGAMGVVYLGRDPKINRVVAIKTMALSQEFEADELDEVKARFFREAETAGRLTHPNIVTIYDAGEEHDLAYIAMEFLHGHDLARYTKEDALLPVPIVMGIIYKSALALNYAHNQHVVHRDIKPANIMYEPETKKVKITDFGIARITDSSKTKTGMVLGTPSYMSPEQLSGKKVDGRSDLFSLGVMLYQLVTGKLPFKGDSMATLMYKIANEPHEDVFKLRPELAKTKPCLAAIINKALQKDVTLRYQTGEEMARDLQECAKRSG